MNYNKLPFALATIALGVVGLAFHDFILQWEPVPAGTPLRTPLAYANGVLLVCAGAALLSRRYERAAALVLALFFGFWTLVLHGIEILENPGTLIIWNGVAEIGFITCGAVALHAAATGAEAQRRWARMLAGACALMFGAVHFHYLDGTASFVPDWIPPNQHFWAAATGAGYIAAGLALLSGVQARLAATLVTIMMACFVVLLHIPRVAAHPGLQVEWCMVAIASTLSGAAWLVRKYAT